MKADECKDIFALLSQYLDEELPSEVCEQVEAHISSCAPCIRFVESLRRSVDLCRSYHSGDQPNPLPQTERDRLMEAYRKMLAARRSG